MVSASGTTDEWARLIPHAPHDEFGKHLDARSWLAPIRDRITSCATGPIPSMCIANWIQFPTMNPCGTINWGAVLSKAAKGGYLVSVVAIRLAMHQSAGRANVLHNWCHRISRFIAMMDCCMMHSAFAYRMRVGLSLDWTR